MTTTFIFTTADPQQADHKAGFWQGMNYKVHTIGPTNAVQLTGDPAPKMIWDSGPNKDWYVVVAEQTVE